nr:odorant receptor 22c-like [Danaus plexippus plexippus]
MSLLFTHIKSSLKFTNVIFTVFGVWPPPGLNDLARRVYSLYSFLLLFLTIGVYIIIQTGDLVQVWGDLTLMTASVFMLFTNIAYAIKFIALSINAAVNLCCDVLVATLIAQCRCRLRLIAQSLRTLCDDVDVDKKGRITADSEKVVSSRVRGIVMRHQLVLAQVEQLQQCFSVPILGQFAVASFIICVTAYQMAFVTNLYRLISMASFEIAVTIQVYIYCVAGTNLTIDSDEVSRAAYECPWYEFPASIRRLLLVIMVRCKRATVITVAGIVEISLDTFMSLTSTRCVKTLTDLHSQI